MILEVRFGGSNGGLGVKGVVFSWACCDTHCVDKMDKFCKCNSLY